MIHVLIVEDNEENRHLLGLLLDANGYRVTAAQDGLAALAAARRDAPDVIVSDALMPKMDGFALCREWMQDPALRSIPFIFYSATYVRPADAQFAMALGAARYLIKPLEAEAFLAELRAVLQQWAGKSAPVPAAPLDELASRAMHESALARKLEDKIAQLEATNRRLRESEARFRSLSEMSSDFYWESDAEHRLTLRTAAGARSSTVPVFERGEQIGARRWDIAHLSPDADGWAAHRAVLDARSPFRDFVLSRLGADGTERFISISGEPAFDDAGAFTGYRGVGTDITGRKAAEAKILRSSQLYAALSQCNEAIVRCASEEELFPQICRDAVQFGGMKMAWIGLVDADTRLVRLRASFGDGAEAYLQGIDISVDAHSPLGQGPTGIAVRENRPVWRQDFQNEPLTAPWHERRLCFGWGASASLPLHRDGVPVGVLTLYAAEAGAFDEAARRLLMEMATDISFALDNFAREEARTRAEEQIRRYVAQIENALMDTVRMATTLGEMRDPYTAGHQRRVAEIAVAIGAGLGFDAHRQEGLRIAGYLHDIGKIKIPSEILSKPGKLSRAELQLVEGHAQASYDVLAHLEFPWPVAEVALQHHERVDGSGYPQGLKGEAIRIESRIVAVADVIEAMSSHRPYRPGLGIERALAEIERGRGSAYDAEVVDVCLRLFREKRFELPV